MSTILGVALCEARGPLADLNEKLSSENGQQWLGELNKFLRKEPTWGQNAEGAEAFTPTVGQPTPELLLELVNDSIIIPATATEFIARDRFVKDTSDKAAVKISYLGDNLKNWFLKGKGKVEKPFGGSTLCSRKLLRNSKDGPILKELGGDNRAETTIIEVFSLMEKQPKGEDGILLTNGWANIFYVKDLALVLRTVIVDWFDDGWDVEAHSVEYPDRWDGGSQVFSRNSFLKSSVPLAPAQA
jgi:hypothetical protein